MGSMHRAEGVVLECRPLGGGVWRLAVDVDGTVRRALLYEQLAPKPAPGDRVVLNTAAVDLGLGTGGFDFVVHVAGRRSARAGRPESPRASGRPVRGHIMKLRYTPLQTPVAAVEEEASPHHHVLASRRDLDGMPVVVVSLHSQLAPAAAALRLALGAGATIVYVMTDGAALPIGFSDTVRDLRRLGVVDKTVTAGHALGGDVEAVTLFSGLLAARWVLGAAAAVVGMGPGVVGTGTPFGTTAVEVGQYADAASLLGGRVFAAPRLSFADPRPRHRGVSHHTLTAFGLVAQRRCTLALPRLPCARRELVRRQLAAAGVYARHDVVEEHRGRAALEWLAAAGVPLRSMGRGPGQEEALFLAAAAAGFLAADRAAGAKWRS